MTQVEPAYFVKKEYFGDYLEALLQNGNTERAWSLAQDPKYRQWHGATIIFRWFDDGGYCRTHHADSSDNAGAATTKINTLKRKRQEVAEDTEGEDAVTLETGHRQTNEQNCEKTNRLQIFLPRLEKLLEQDNEKMSDLVGEALAGFISSMEKISAAFP